MPSADYRGDTWFSRWPAHLCDRHPHAARARHIAGVHRRNHCDPHHRPGSLGTGPVHHPPRQYLSCLARFPDGHRQRPAPQPLRLRPMWKLALRNVLRQKARTGMTLLAIIAGVLGLILSGGFVHDIFTQLGEVLIHSQSGHMQVARSGYFEHGARSPEKYLIDDPEALRKEILATQGWRT